MKPLLFILLVLIGAPITAQTKDQGQDSALEQSFRSCSLITSELLTAVQFRQQGLTIAQLKESLPTNSPHSLERIQQIYSLVEKDGLETTYRTLNDLYQACAKDVYDRRGAPPRETSEFGFYYCSGENKVRNQILHGKAAGTSRDNVLKSIPPSRHQIARDLLTKADKEGLLAAYEQSARDLKICLNEVLGLPTR